MFLQKFFKPNVDDRRTISPCEFPVENFVPRESKIINKCADGAVLGLHSHPHKEVFHLIAGTCLVRTWSEQGGMNEYAFTAPVCFMFEPNEEHVVICSKTTVLFGQSPVVFEEENNVESTHL